MVRDPKFLGGQIKFWKATNSKIVTIFSFTIENSTNLVFMEGGTDRLCQVKHKTNTKKFENFYKALIQVVCNAYEYYIALRSVILRP